jgi:GNAT superfamily N-acetyltransferase
LTKTSEIRKIVASDVKDLLSEGYPYQWILSQALGNRLSKLSGLVPNRIGFVVYNTGEKYALGFLSLVKHTQSLFSIGYIYIAPEHRNKGLATELINHAVDYAHEKGCKKVYLNANYNDAFLLDFYLKRKFHLVVKKMMLWGGGDPKNLYTEIDGWQASSIKQVKATNDRLLSACAESMGKNWLDFFELNNRNITNGFLKMYTHFYSKADVIFPSDGSVAFIFNRPMLKGYGGFVELYLSPNSKVISVLNNLSLVLSKKGFPYVKLTVFNVEGTECFDFLNERNFFPFQARILGQILA